MKRQTRNAGKILDQFFARASKPSPEQVDSSRRRILRRLNSDEAFVAPALDADPVRVLRKPMRTFRLAVAVAAVVTVVSAGVFLQSLVTGLDRTIARTVDGPLYRVSPGESQAIDVGENIERDTLIRSNDGGVFALTDGSRVEMRAQAELSLERAVDGVRIRLNKGGIIVNAAKQRKGHLYVQTKDMTVSVVGTVFLVNAEEEGSRVAVIEGEVRVQQGAAEKKLGPGEQATTNPKMESLQVKEEVAWSREAVAHVALLQGAVRIPASQSPAFPTPREERLAFEVATIRPAAPKPAPGPGARSGGTGASQVDCQPAGTQLDPRRLSLKDVSLYELVAFAYGRCADITDFNRLSGGPEWTKSERWDVEALISEGSVDPLPTGFSGPQGEFLDGRSPKIQKMLRTLLEERFKVVVRREMKEMPVYVLAVGPNGTKFQGNTLPSNMPRGAVFGFIGADGTLATPGDGAESSRINLAARCEGETTGRGCSNVAFWNQYMAIPASVLSGLVGRHVLDGTGIQEKVSFSIEWTRTEGYVPGQLPSPPGFQVLSRALAAVGLQLKEDPKGVVEMFVIDRAEKPTEN